MTGSVLAAKQNTGVALVKGGISPLLDKVLIHHLIDNFKILGGEAAVPQSVIVNINEYLNRVAEEKFQKEFDFRIIFNADKWVHEYTKLKYQIHVRNVSSFNFFINEKERVSPSTYNTNPIFTYFEANKSLFISSHIKWYDDSNESISLKLEFTGKDGVTHERSWLIDEDFVKEDIDDKKLDLYLE